RRAQATPDLDDGQPRGDARAPLWGPHEEGLVQRLEAIGEDELVLLAAAEELDTRQPFGGARLEHVERIQKAGRATPELGIEAEPVGEERAAEREVRVERDRSPVELERDDASDVELSEPAVGRPVELPPCLGLQA